MFTRCDIIIAFVATVITIIMIIIITIMIHIFITIIKILYGFDNSATDSDWP